MAYTSSENNYLGSGISFPLSIKDGKIAENSLEERVRQSILIILQTSKNERVMRSDFGCGLNDLAFMPINATTITLVKNTIYEALSLFEPRISLMNVKVEGSSKESGVLNISIDYVINETNEPQNLVYPFFIEGVR